MASGSSSDGGIYYTAVVYNRQILCSCSAGSALYESTLEYIVPQVDTSRVGDKLAFNTHDGLAVYFLIAERGVLFTCITLSSFNRQRAYACLEALLKNFESANLFSRVVEAGPYGLMSSFSLALQVQMEKFSKPDPNGGGQGMLNDLQAKVEEVKVVMVRNVQKMLDRGERLEDLENRAESLEMRSGQFRITATQVRKKMWWENLKMKIIIAAVVITVVFIVIMASLGSAGVFNINKNQQQQQQQSYSTTPSLQPSSTVKQ